MEHAQLNTVVIGQVVKQVNQRDLGAVQLPVAGEDATIFVAVAIAQHDVLLATAFLDHLGNAGQLVVAAHDGLGIAQVFNGFKQGHHDQVANRPILQRAAHQAHFFLQQQHFQQIAHRFGVADDAVANGFAALQLAQAVGGLENAQFAARMVRVFSANHTQRARIFQQAHQQRTFGVFLQRAIARLQPRHGQQLLHHGLMFVRALAQVHRSQMKAKHLHRTHQRVQALRCQHVAVIGRQRIINDLQIRQKLVGSGIGVLRRNRMARRIAARQLLERGCKPCINARQRPAVGLVAAVHIGVGRCIGQRPHLGGDFHQVAGQRQLTAQPVHFAQIVAQGHIGLTGQRQLQALGRHKRIAVAVATNPLTHAQKAVGRQLLAEFLLQLGVDLGNLVQKRGFVVRQRVFNLVGHRQLGVAQQPRLPQLGHTGAQLRIHTGQLARGQRILGAVVELGAHFNVIALGQQLGNAALGHQNALALHLGGVSRQHGGNKALDQHLRHRA